MYDVAPRSDLAVSRVRGTEMIEAILYQVAAERIDVTACAAAATLLFLGKALCTSGFLPPWLMSLV